jgi:phage shock protein A
MHSDPPKRPATEPPAPSKSPEDQVKELDKLVADARDSLAQVSRGLDALRERVRTLNEE